MRAIADCILNIKSEGEWPPAEEDIRLVAAIAIGGLEASGEQIAHTGPPAEAGEEAVYAYLARVVAAGEPAAGTPASPTPTNPADRPYVDHPERSLHSPETQRLIR